MKKIIATFIIALVAFSAFAASGEGSSTLTIGADVAGKLLHGFSTTAYTTADTVKDGTIGTATSTATLDLEIGTAQQIGYYNLYTTGAAQATVNLTASPLTVTMGTGDDAVTYYVPYQLSWAAGSGNDTVTITDGTIGSAVVAKTTAVASSNDDVLTTTGSGLRWQTLSLSATFAGSDNVSFGLPESDAYTGTIVAAVTAD